jgi:uncharacterized protein (DUF2249 family)
MMATAELDVRTLPPAIRTQAIFRTFDGLKPAEGFVIVSDPAQDAVLRELQTRRPTEFEWSVLEGGPEVFRVQINRRLRGTRSVTECLSWDQDRLVAIFEEVGKYVGLHAFEEATAAFRELAYGLGRHIEMEEKVLFEVFEELAQATGGHTAAMRLEHELLRQTLKQLSDALEKREVGAFTGAARDLRRLLSEHTLKEERIFCPITDMLLGSDAARERVVERLQGI